MALNFPAEPARQLLLARADSHDATLTEVGDILGLPRRTLHRLLTRPRLRWDAADRVAVALGYHPSELWPDWFGADPHSKAKGKEALIERLTGCCQIQRRPP